ncbi:MAG: PLD nuclease N-terminal domain-containing protein [Desulfobacula sp.]|nr:PLD nuclease N-terminal domain-containing protein [Desulfobacula sp.]
MGIGIYELLILLILLNLILWIVAFFDVLRNKFTWSNKLIWFIAITFIPIVGVIAYFFIGRKKKLK